MSTVILYLAIVAIWLCVLLPRWIRRPDSIAQDPGAEADDEGTADGSAASDAASRSSSGGFLRRRPADLRAPLRPPPSRPRILQARRRLLTTLLTLAIAAASCTAAGLARWWICIPPAGMLGMYLLLLREAAVADTEAELRHHEAIRARAAVQRARQAWAAREPEPTAEIIDISARVRDQLYDQYTDATVRAVGD